MPTSLLIQFIEFINSIEILISIYYLTLNENLLYSICSSKKNRKRGGTAQSLSDDIVYYQTAYQRHIFL